jgi:hypothetical protein
VAVVASDQADSHAEAGGPAHRWNRAARVHPALALVLAGVLVPTIPLIALWEVFVVLDWLAPSLGLAEGGMPGLGAILLVLPAAGTVFTALVLVTLLIPEGRRLLGRANPDPAARRRYTRVLLWASLAPFLTWGLALVIASPLIARSTREGWGWIIEVLGFAAYGLSLLAGLVFIMRLPLRLPARCVIGTAYAALVGYLLFPFTLFVALSISGQVL